MTVTDTEAPPGVVTLSDGRRFEPGRGGAGDPDLAFSTNKGRHYLDPLPWDEVLGALGYPRESFRPNMEFMSVTTKLENLPTHRLVAWNGRAAAECGAKPHVRAMVEKYGADVMVPWIAKAGERIRDEAGERGTAMHNIAEDPKKVLAFAAEELLRHHELDPWFTEKANCRPYVRALQKFFAAYPGIIPLWTEVTVFNRALGIGGTLDLMAWVPGLGIVLIDWKSSNFVLAKFSFQLVGYALAEYAIIDGIRVPLFGVDGHYVVHLMPGNPDVITGEQDGAFEVRPLDTDPDQLEIFDACTKIAKWDHPSRIGKALPNPSDDGLSHVVYGHERPDITIVTPAEMAARFVAERGYHELPQDLSDSVFGKLHQVVPTWQPDDLGGPDELPIKPEPIEVVAEPEPAELSAEDLAAIEREVDRQYAEHVELERAWFRRQMEYLTLPEHHVPGLEGERTWLVNDLAAFWRASGVPPYSHPEFGVDPDLDGPYQALLAKVQAATDQLAMPFDPRPEMPNWDRLRDELTEDMQMTRFYQAPPNPTMADLGRVLEAARAGTLDPVRGRVVTLAHRAVSVAPDAWGEPANPSLVEECTALADRAAVLPADMRDRLDAWKLRLGLPNLRTISMTPEHLRIITAEVDRMCAEWYERSDAAHAVIAATVAPQDVYEFTELLLGMAGVQTVPEATATELEQMMLLCRGVQRGDIGMTFEDGSAKPVLVSMVNAIALAGRYGTKSALRNAAREAAARLGLPSPSSAAKVAESVVLVAALGEPDDETMAKIIETVTGGDDAGTVESTGSAHVRGSEEPDSQGTHGDTETGGDGVRGHDEEHEAATGDETSERRQPPTFEIGEDVYPGPTE